MKLVVATRNQGKLKEIYSLLAPFGIEVVGLDRFPQIGEIEETGATFEDNARLKAETVARLTGLLTLADDSGLTVAALDGRPGVHSARYAGPAADDAANNAKLLAELAAVPVEQRSAAFVCCMALFDPDDNSCRIFSGLVSGRIQNDARGDGGFGYDPLFFVPAYGKTMAELSLATKNRISHRGAALRQVISFLTHHD
ncbi:MAG: XTP/dITP diphosphatase [Desulfuromonadaceae bacterium]|nr:XTP/dITP diphosphatase [Desulfuromonadaceae bacterium]